MKTLDEFRESNVLSNGLTLLIIFAILILCLILIPSSIVKFITGAMSFYLLVVMLNGRDNIKKIHFSLGKIEVEYKEDKKPRYIKRNRGESKSRGSQKSRPMQKKP